MRALIAGATGFVGRRLAPALIADGHSVRCLARDPSSPAAAELAADGCEVVRADLADDDGAGAALEGVDVAYYLVHLIGTGDDYGEREAAIAKRFARAAREAGVERLIYLGGLGDDAASPHLRSRHATAMALRDAGPPLTYFRAAMIVGAGSESWILVRDIATRLPAVPDRAWMRRRTQPIGIREAVRYLRDAPGLQATRGREIEIGGPEALTPLEIVDRAALALGSRPPAKLRIPGATPGAVAAGAEAVTRGTGAVASELALGLSCDTVVTDPSGMELFEIAAEPFDVSLQRAIEQEERMREAA